MILHKSRKIILILLTITGLYYTIDMYFAYYLQNWRYFNVTGIQNKKL